MRDIILNSPKQLEKGLEVAAHIKLEGRFNKIIICGVGGSALPANILITYLFDDLKIPVFSHRTYNLPPQTDDKSLIVAISYSGNTEETISAYQQAIERGLKVAAIATGGKLKEMAEKNKQPIAVIPMDAGQPRFAVGYQSAALLKILANSRVIEDKTEEISEAAKALKPAELEERGRGLAKKLVDKIPVVYASSRFRTLARIWKIKFNENSKIMAFWNYFPELNHNEMVGFTRIKNYESRIKNFHIIILRDKDDQTRILKRMKLTADLIKEAGADVDFVEIEGKNTLEKIFSNLILGDWVTYYLALEYGEDPIPVKIVEELKKRLAE